jgi:hypothetical protein
MPITASPFGSMFGITIEDAEIRGRVALKDNVRTSEASVSGSVQIGSGKHALSLPSAKITFVNGAPRVVSIMAKVNLSIGQIFKSYLERFCEHHPLQI